MSKDRRIPLSKEQAIEKRILELLTFHGKYTISERNEESKVYALAMMDLVHRQLARVVYSDSFISTFEITPKGTAELEKLRACKEN